MSFDGVTVLDRIDLELAAGEVHGLIGENGSGKSTLVKILGGVHVPEADSACELWGRGVPFPLVKSQLHGLAIIHQDLALSDGMTVAENVAMSTGFGRRILAPLNGRRIAEDVRRLSAEYGLELPPNAPVGSLAPAERSLVAILRALWSLRSDRRNHVLILDEPTAALPYSESQRLLAIIRSLAASGTAVLFISHRLNEVLDVCDRVSVLRSGRLVSTVACGETTDSQLVSLMLGYDLGDFYPGIGEPVGRDAVLQVTGLSGAGIEDVSFDVSEGEILGLTGLVGMGQDEVPYLLTGHARSSAGAVRVRGEALGRSIQASLRAGMALVPGNRLRDSIWSAGTAVENLTLPFVPQFSKAVLNHRAERRFVADQMKRFGVRPLTPSRPMARFSGGNQQKIVLARWLQTKPKVLLLHEPTQGVDAGAKKDIFGHVRDVASSGAGVVIFSSDLEEVANVCHRVLIMRHGRICGQLAKAQLSEDSILAACLGTRSVPEPREAQ